MTSTVITRRARRVRRCSRWLRCLADVDLVPGRAATADDDHLIARRKPLATTVSSPSARAIFILRSSTVESGLTTNTYCPVGPLCNRAEGATTASFCSCSVSTT